MMTTARAVVPVAAKARATGRSVPPERTTASSSASTAVKSTATTGTSRRITRPPAVSPEYTRMGPRSARTNRMLTAATVIPTAAASETEMDAYSS